MQLVAVVCIYIYIYIYMCVVVYHALLLIDMYHNCIRTGLEVLACTVSTPHIRNKVIFIN